MIPTYSMCSQAQFVRITLSFRGTEQKTIQQKSTVSKLLRPFNFASLRMTKTGFVYRMIDYAKCKIDRIFLMVRCRREPFGSKRLSSARSFVPRLNTLSMRCVLPSSCIPFTTRDAYSRQYGYSGVCPAASQNNGLSSV